MERCPTSESSTCWLEELSCSVYKSSQTQHFLFVAIQSFCKAWAAVVIFGNNKSSIHQSSPLSTKWKLEQLEPFMTNKRDFHNAQSVCFLLVKGREEEMRLSLNNHLFVVNIQSKNHDPIKLSTFPWEEIEKGMRKLTDSRESIITSTHCACTWFWNSSMLVCKSSSKSTRVSSSSTFTCAMVAP